MNNLTRSCLRILLVYAVFAVAVGLFVYHRFPDGAVAFWSGVIAGFFVWLTLAYLWAIPTQLLDWWRMRSGAPPRDGKRVAIIGVVHASSGSLHSPFSKTQCVAYEYKVVSLKGEHPKDDYEGFAMVPSYISTDQGQVRLLAYPELDVKEEPVRGADMKTNAREYIDATPFKNMRAEGIKAAMKELKELLADDDGTIRYDHRIEPVAESIDMCRLTEKVIRPGDTVCVLGKYSEEKRALVPDPDASVHAATIRKGTPAAFRRGALRKAFGSAIGVVICGGLVTGAVLVFLLNIPMDASEQMNPKRRLLWPEVKLERWLEKEVRTPLVKAGTLGTPGMHLMDDLCPNCATGRLEAYGKVVQLDKAAAWENEEKRVITLTGSGTGDDGVTVTFDRKDNTWQIVLSVDGRKTAVRRDWTLPTDVQTALGSDQILDGRATVLAPDDSLKVRAAFKVAVEGR